MPKKRIVLIVNPKAGQCKGVKQLGEITLAIQERGYFPTVLMTRRSGDASRFACEHGNDAEAICCVGGDGTFSEVVAGMVAGRHSAPIGYIPAGSTNDYASSLGLSRNLHIAALNAVDGFSQSFDIGMFNGHPFAYTAAFGMLAKVSYSTPQKLKNIVGRLAYFLEGIRDLHSLRAEAMTIDTDGERIEGKYLFGAVSNTTSIGGILHFDSGDVKLNDGYLELLLISKPSSLREFAQFVHALSTRAYSESSCIIYRKCKRVRIISHKRIPWTLDGEPAKESDQVDIEVVPQAIHVMTPLLQ